MVTNQGETSPVVRNVMTLDTCAAIIGSEVMSFATEEELLKASQSGSFARVKQLMWNMVIIKHANTVHMRIRVTKCLQVILSVLC